MIWHSGTLFKREHMSLDGLFEITKLDLLNLDVQKILSISDFQKNGGVAPFELNT